MRSVISAKRNITFCNV